MIENLILDTIEAAKKEKSTQTKLAEEKAESSDPDKSYIALSLRKLAEQLRKVGSSSSPEPEGKEQTKVAEESVTPALKGLSLLKRYVEGNYAR